VSSLAIFCGDIYPKRGMEKRILFCENHQEDVQSFGIGFRSGAGFCLHPVVSLPGFLEESPDRDHYGEDKEPQHEGGRCAEELVQPVTRIQKKKGGDGDDETPGAQKEY
jgi:hypothetical protein